MACLGWSLVCNFPSAGRDSAVSDWLIDLFIDRSQGPMVAHAAWWSVPNHLTTSSYPYLHSLCFNPSWLSWFQHLIPSAPLHQFSPCLAEEGAGSGGWQVRVQKRLTNCASCPFSCPLYLELRQETWGRERTREQKDLRKVLGAPALALKAAKFMRNTGLLGQFEAVP
jgi:hypothetical protein